MARRRNTDPYEQRLKDTRRKLNEALDRLVKRMPTHPDLQRRRYQLNVSVLAREAGVGRNAIYQNHRAVIDKLKEARDRRFTPKELASWEDKVAELRALNRELNERVRRVVTENAALIERSRRAEAKCKHLARDNARLIRERDERLKPAPIASRSSNRIGDGQ